MGWHCTPVTKCSLLAALTFLHRSSPSTSVCCPPVRWCPSLLPLSFVHLLTHVIFSEPSLSLFTLMLELTLTDQWEPLPTGFCVFWEVSAIFWTPAFFLCRRLLWHILSFLCLALGSVLSGWFQFLSGMWVLGVLCFTSFTVTKYLR